MNSRIGILGAPITVAQPKDGVDLGPQSIRYAGLVDRLTDLNLTISDYGDVPVTNERSHHVDPKTNLRNLPIIAKNNQLIADYVYDVKKKGDFPLVLGGDHSIAIGTIAGLHHFYDKLGVIWFDAHADLNSGDTSPSGNIHGMSLAASLGIGHDELTDIHEKRSKIKPEKTVIIGARSVDQGERELIQDLGIKVYTMHDLEKDGITRVMEDAIEYLHERVDGIHLSLDVDGIDPTYTPGTGTPVSGGPTYRETHLAMSMLHDAQLLTSMEVVEVNPLLDKGNQTAEIARDMIAAFFGEKYC
ncbi:arginase [Alkalibacillus sp. S2W]|uniref:arginase n=1 Tax=Alkalibacillus sp. S2W TaxID=3386553 RepID=UPI00398CF677